MSAIWDSDTGTITLTATKNGAPVNLSGVTSRLMIVQNVDTGVATSLATTATDLPNGVVSANASALVAGVYRVVLRVVDATVTATYPTADVGPESLTVRADLDAV